MAISVDFKIEKDYLLVTAWGKDDSLEEVTKYQQSIAAEAFKHHTPKILCDERKLIYGLSLNEEFNLGKGLAQYSDSLEKLAIVHNDQFEGIMQFFEDVTNNVGVKLLATSSIEEAKNWISPD
jgi:hypothetical protein